MKRYAIAVAIGGAVLAGCSIPVPPELEAQLEAAQEWSAPEKHVDPMTGAGGWMIQSPLRNKEKGKAAWETKLAGVFVSVGCSSKEGAQSESSRLMAEFTEGVLAATIMFPSMDWWEWGRGQPAEGGLWQHSVLIQWDGDPTTARRLNLVGTYGAPFVVRGDETEQFLIELAKHTTLRMRADKIYEVALQGAREQLVKLTEMCLQEAQG